MNYDAKSICKTFDALKTDRMPIDARWERNAKYCFPPGVFITRRPMTGQDLENKDVYDDTAIEANERWAAGVHQNLTSSTMKWYKIETHDHSLMELEEVEDWLSEAVDVGWSHLVSSNFNTEIQQMYREAGWNGNPTMLQLPDPEDVFMFRLMPVSSVFFVENAKRKVDLIYIELEYTVRQVLDEFGEEGLDKEIQAEKKKGNFLQKFKFIWCIGPRSERDQRKFDKKNMPFFSLYVNPRSQKIVKEEGFETFPAYVMRLIKSPYTPYAYSIADMKMPTIKDVNNIKRLMIRKSSKETDPATMSPINAFGSRINKNPGGHSFYNGQAVKDLGRPPIEVIPTGGSLAVGLENLTDGRESIKRGFLNDLFSSLDDGKKRTAFEVAQLISEKMSLMGPMTGGIIEDVLTGCVIRTTTMCIQSGALRPPPESLIDRSTGDTVRLKVKLVSPLAVAQRASEAQTILEFIQIIGEMAGYDPTALDKLDIDKAIDLMAKLRNVPLSLIKNQREVDALRQMKAEAQRQAELLAAGQGIADAAQKFSNVEKNLAGAKSGR